MKFTSTRRSPYVWLLLVVVVIGLLSSLWLVKERHEIEQHQMTIENIVDYDAVVRASSFEKRSFPDALKALRDARITGMAIYDRTLTKAVEAGEVDAFTVDGNTDFKVYEPIDLGGTTFIRPIMGKEGYYQEIKEDLVRRLGSDKVQQVHTSKGYMLALKQPHDALMDMNLGISRLQAEEVSKLGFNLIVRPTNYKEVTKEDVDHVFRRIEGIPHVTGMVFVGKEALGYPHQLQVTEGWMKKVHIPVVGIEAVNQLQYNHQAGFDELAKHKAYSVGRLYTVSKEEMKKLTPSEVSQWFYISDLERNIRYNLFPIYDQGLDNHTALESSIQYIKTVTGKLEARGFSFGAPSIYPAYTPNVMLRLLVITGAIALFTMTLSLFVYLGRNKQLVLFFGLSLVSFVAYIVVSSTIVSQIWALSAAITAPVFAIILLMECWVHRSHKPLQGCIRATVEALVYVVGAAVIAAIGGMYIASLLGSTEFFMEFALFRGVKLVFVAPVVLTAIAYIQRFPLWKGRTIRNWQETKTFVGEFLQTDIKLYGLLIAALLGAAAWVFVGRSGHTAGVPVPSFELALRRFLENIMYARPREKEFLIGHPALVLAGFGALRKWPTILHFVCTVIGVIGISSMVETFCHLRTPVWMSIMRGVDGVLLGLLCGIVALVGVRFMQYVTRWNLKGSGHE